jgi:alpha-glucosidase (family GH31 glycosyl hydrolase)
MKGGSGRDRARGGGAAPLLRLSEWSFLIGGVLRCQFLSPSLLRLEKARMDGSFCDERTFLIPQRSLSGERAELLSQDAEQLRVGCGSYSLEFQAAHPDPEGGSLTVNGAGAQPVSFGLSELARRALEGERLPSPGATQPVWAMADRPRALVPPWGALPPPQGAPPDSGWVIEPDAWDLYVFIHCGDLKAFRREFLDLVGRIPLPPLWAFGLWTSRYYPYDEEHALEVIDTYRAHGIPLDVFVVDTDWRVGASRGYVIDQRHFPDMKRFLRSAHDRNVKVVFNDHPEPREWGPLDPELFQYRFDNLTRLLDMGLDTWWFDRNWREIIRGPAPGLETAVWGQNLYYSILEKHTPERRTFILSMRSDHPASHRYPIWWTGDIPSDWGTLREAVRETLADGSQLRPYTSQDIGGHIGYPSPEQYLRWMQWGSISPTMRLHSGPLNRFRYPWRFGERALQISRSFVRLRYRLLPLIYGQARRAFEAGSPILAAMAERYPDAPPEASLRQGLLGEELLVVPVTEPAECSALSEAPFPGDKGYHYTVYRGRQPAGEPSCRGWDPFIRLNAANTSERHMAWGSDFTVVWEGSFTPQEEGWYQFRLTGNGRKELSLNPAEPPQMMRGFDMGSNEVTLPLEGGTTYPIRVTYCSDDEGFTDCLFACRRLPELQELPPVPVSVWIPGQTFRDLRSGDLLEGPATHRIEAALHTLPMLVRCGSILPLAPVMSYASEKPWDPVTVEVFPHRSSGVSETALYEDDGQSNAYREGEFEKTPLSLRRDANQLHIAIGGTGPQEGKANRRSWVLRVHLLPGEACGEAQINGRPAQELPGVRLVSKLPLRPTARGGGGNVPFVDDGGFALFWQSDTVRLEVDRQAAGARLEILLSLSR